MLFKAKPKPRIMPTTSVTATGPLPGPIPGKNPGSNYNPSIGTEPHLGQGYAPPSHPGTVFFINLL